MRVECAWCKKDMGEKEPFENSETTGGICPKCFKKENAKLNEMDKDSRKDRFINY